MGIEEGTFWDEHWVLYGNQFDDKFHILKKKMKAGSRLPTVGTEPDVGLETTSEL